MRISAMRFVYTVYQKLNRLKKKSCGILVKNCAFHYLRPMKPVSISFKSSFNTVKKTKFKMKNST